MFRTLVIKRAGSSEPVCLTILPKKPTYHLKTLANFTGTGEDAVTGYVSLVSCITTHLSYLVHYKNTKFHNVAVT